MKLKELYGSLNEMMFWNPFTGVIYHVILYKENEQILYEGNLKKAIKFFGNYKVKRKTFRNGFPYSSVIEVWVEQGKE